jgi:hypothetical protein
MKHRSVFQSAGLSTCLLSIQLTQCPFLQEGNRLRFSWPAMSGCKLYVPACQHHDLPQCVYHCSSSA